LKDWILVGQITKEKFVCKFSFWDDNTIESTTFEQKVEVQERHIEEYSEFDAFLRRTKGLRKAMKLAKKKKPLAFGKRVSSSI
jgi:hypothetical protein